MFFGHSAKTVGWLVSFAALVIYLGLAAPPSVFAQVTGATLSGTITDPSGAVIAGAQVSITNTATGITKDTTTDSAGFYTVLNLSAGPYEVKATATGFATVVQSNLVLAVAAQQLLNIPLKVGQTSQTVQVSEAAPQIDLTSSMLTGQVESQTVLDLPLNGRDWTSLATLHPGVALIEEQMDYSSSARGNRGFGAELTISGQRTTYNNYRLDGISINDYANSGPGNVIGAALGVDAIQEFSVLTGGFTADYGKAAGGVVNAITKSGTNAFHGDVYEFIRNSALDSRDYFARAANSPNPTFRRNQFGAAAGGPIIKDKTFIFGDYEGMRQTKGITTTINVPSLNARAGHLANGTIVSVDPAATAAFRMYPTPTPGTTKGDKARFINSGVQNVPENFYTFRVDHKLSANDSLGGTYLFDDTDFKQPDAFNNDILNSHTRRQTVVLQESHTFSPSVLNAARVGFSRTHVINLSPAGALNPAATDPTLGEEGGNAPLINITGYTRMPGGVGVGGTHIDTFNNYQFYDDAFWRHGSHTVKFGGGVERMQYNFQQLQIRLWKFNSLTDFLTNNASHFEEGIPRAVPPQHLRQTLFGGYVQDDWRFRSNLTLNLGLRYEMVTVLNDTERRISNLLNISNSAPQCGMQYTSPVLSSLAGGTCSSVGPYYSNPTTRNFEPRIGFAWDPFRDGKTSVRGGFGIYDVLPLPGYFTLQLNNDAPFAIFSSVNAPAGSTTSFLTGKFPTQGQSVLVNPPPGIQPGKLSASAVETHPHRNYVLEWNLNVQRQIAPTLSLTVGFVGSHGVHNLIRGDDGNMTQGVQTSAGLLFPCGAPILTDGSCTPGNNATGTTAKINPAVGIIRYIFWGTDSEYDGLNVSLDKKMSHGLQFQFSYTWGKSLDESSSTVAGDTFEQGLNSLYYFDPKALRGLSDFNVAHTIAVNTLWAIPTPQFSNGLAQTALGGWQMGGIVKFNTGVPTTPIIGGDPMALGNAGADQFGIPDLVPGCDPINHNFIGSATPIYINANCYTPPTAPASFASQCGDFKGAKIPAPSGQVYCANLLGNAGRNSVTGPHLVDLDFAMLKNTSIKRISETFNVQFRAEIFNIFNHSNFLPPEPVRISAGAQVLNQDGSVNSSAGAMDAPSTQPRDVQFALKIIW